MKNRLIIISVALSASFALISNHPGQAQRSTVGVFRAPSSKRDSGPLADYGPQVRIRLADILAAKQSGIDASQSLAANSSRPVPMDGTPALLRRTAADLTSPSTSTAQSLLPTWSDSFTYQGLTYKYSMVGTDPKLGSKTTVIPTVIIPLRFVFPDGQVFDSSTDLVDGQTAVQGIINSPIFKNYNFVLGGKSVGNTQYGDAFQRANFWDSVGSKSRDYHVLLSQPTVLPTQTIVVPDGLGSYRFDYATGVQIPIVDLAFMESQTAPILTAANVNPAQLPIMVWGTIEAGYAFGYHGAVINGNLQTFIGTGYHSQATSGGSAPDTYILSHEIIEWLDDPFIKNVTPGWNHAYISESLQCDSRPEFDLLETADPVETIDEGVVTLNGGPFTYHVTEGMFIDFYTRSRRSRSINGQYSMFNIGAQFGIPSAPSSPCTGHIELTDRLLLRIGGSSLSEAYGVNNEGSVVGIYVDQAGLAHGYLLTTVPSLSAQSLDYPGASQTIPNQINDAGVIVGFYFDTLGVAHGFKFQDGQFSTIDFPGALETLAYDINLNGDIVGQYFGADFQSHGFLFRNAAFSTIDIPFHRSNGATSINSVGQIAGFTSVQFGAASGFPTLGFLMSGKRTSDVVFPGSNETFPWDINNLSMMTGIFTNSNSYDSGFVTINDLPYEVYGHVYGLNDSNMIVGSYTVGGVTKTMLGNLPAAQR